MSVNELFVTIFSSIFRRSLRNESEYNICNLCFMSAAVPSFHIITHPSPTMGDIF